MVKHLVADPPCDIGKSYRKSGVDTPTRRDHARYYADVIEFRQIASTQAERPWAIWDE